MPELLYLEEPTLLFRYDQPMVDPRDGLSLFGPLEKAKPEGIRWAVIGPKGAIARMKAWVNKIQHPVMSGNALVARPLFPVFEAAFQARWAPVPALEYEVLEDELRQCAYNADSHQRVYKTVDIYASRIKAALREEDVRPDLWCVVIPEYVYQNCRPKSNIPADLRVKPDVTMTVKQAKHLQKQPALFTASNELAQEYLYEVNFHHQLKARLLHHEIPTQVIREIKIAYQEFITPGGQLILDLRDLESAIAWNLSTAIFYKAGGRPWKLGAAREGVCYIGLAFKQDERDRNPRTACCAAQMFLDTGDGVVFKGAVGPWYRGKRGLFHLDREAARKVVDMCVNAYADKKGGTPPKELFIHGRIEFNDEEWAGFQEGAGPSTKVVGVRIMPVNTLKLYRLKDRPILRGLAYLIDDRKAYFWTRGMIQRLRTYPGREVPNPLFIHVCRGTADMQTVLADILALTKLNYNTCNYADGLPVTLKFADAVGEILTAGPTRKLNVPPLQFKYYI